MVLGIFVLVELLLRMGWVLGFPPLFVAISALVERRLTFMRIVFMGTPDFAVPSLTSLVAAGNEIALVVTRPDAVRGRGKKLEPSPVKAKALELGLLRRSRLPRLTFSAWLPMVVFCPMRCYIWRRLAL